MTGSPFSTAQMFGHAALIISMVAFSRKRDTHFKMWLIVQSVLYATHFFLMGNPAATIGTTLTAIRTLVSMKTRSIWVLAVLLTATLAPGFWVVKVPWNAIPLLASAIATVAMFRLHGLRLRYTILFCTLLWLGNNILTGSIGGTIMEALIAVISGVTILRLHREAATLKTTDAHHSGGTPSR